MAELVAALRAAPVIVLQGVRRVTVSHGKLGAGYAGARYGKGG